MHLAEPGWMETRPGLWEHNLGGKHDENLG
jgi:hypothetical protein